MDTGLAIQYSVKEANGRFTVIDSDNEKMGTYSTQSEALEEIKRCREEDAIYDRAKALVENAVVTLMREHGLDRDAAELV
jgi:hypothetical protein